MIFESETYVSRKNDARQFMSQTVTEKVNPGRANNFDFLRLVLAILVIFSHSYPLLRGDNTTEPFIRLSGGQLTGGGARRGGFLHTERVLDHQELVPIGSLAGLPAAACTPRSIRDFSPRRRSVPWSSAPWRRTGPWTTGAISPPGSSQRWR